ncbi:MAG: DNA polymerase III subunit delta' C-terminal domain-containing protein [Eubacteriales bacterium]
MRNFTDIVGQDSIKEYFQNVIAQEKLSHAYVFQGEQRSGKEFISKIVAMTLQCSDRQEIEGMIQPCGNCPSCMQTMTMNQPDIIYVTHEKKSIGVDDIRRQVNEDVYIKPYSSKYKIYMIADADKMTQEAQNAILKTLEEPPSYAIIILLVANTEMLLDTILSRCVMLRMQPVREDALRNYLLEVVQIPDYRVNLCIAFARGNLGRAKQLAEKEDFEQMRQEVVRLLKHMKDMEVSELIQAMEQMKEYNIEVSDYLDLIAIWYRDVLLFKATNDMNHLIFKEEIQQIKSVATTSDYAGLEYILDAIEIAKSRLRAKVKQELAMELLLLTLREN